MKTYSALEAMAKLKEVGISVSVQTVRTWIRNGTLPALRVGRKWFVDADGVEELIKKAKQRTV